MNWKNLFFISTAFWIGAIVLMNCTSPKEPVKEPQMDSNITYCEKNPEKCAKIVDQIEGYDELLGNNLLKLIRNNSDIAPPVIGGVEIDRAVISMEMDTLKGFRFSGEEFRQMGHLAKQQSADDKVYVMFAINTDPESIKHREKLRTPIKYLDIYFQVKTKDGNIAMYDRSGEELNDYGDFPDPCPVVCP